jgi:hypothetical protein
MIAKELIMRGLAASDWTAFQAVYEALDQYISNTEEIEEELDEDGQAKLDSAREMMAECDAVMCSLADS